MSTAGEAWVEPRSSATGGAGVRPVRSTQRGASAGQIVLYAVAGLILFYLIFPLFVVIPVSFSSAKYLQFPPPGLSLQWYDKYFSRSDWTGATWLSLRIGLSTALLATALGTLASLALVRGRFRGRDLINSFIVSPMIIPTIVVAVGVYFFFADLQIIGRWYALVLAHTALAIPFVIVNVSATLYGFDERLEYAAMNLGADRWQTFFKVTLPIIRPGVFAGALFAFITSFDELIIALFLSGTGAVTLPMKMWSGVRQEIDPTIAAVSSLLIAISVLVLVSAELLRQRSERMRTGAPRSTPLKE